VSEAENVAAVRDFVERAWNGGDEEVFEEHLAPEFVSFGGREAFKVTILGFRDAFPDLRLDVHDMFGSGDRVVTRFTITGTHEDEFLGIPPTGRYVEVEGIAIDVMRDGRRVEGWAQLDMLGLIGQLRD
jgi:steroid delta-isomerase-like uncharacterized protein